MSISDLTSRRFCTYCGKEMLIIEDWKADLYSREAGTPIRWKRHLCCPNSPIRRWWFPLRYSKHDEYIQWAGLGTVPSDYPLNTHPVKY